MKPDEVKRYETALQALAGNDEQARTEINRICNRKICNDFELLLPATGFTILIYAVRKFYQEYGAVNSPEFGENLLTMIRMLTDNRQPESDGGKAARQYLSHYYDDFKP